MHFSRKHPILNIENKGVNKMDNQWLLYGISSVVLIILIRRTILSGNIVLSCLLGAILLIQVVGVALCAQQKKKMNIQRTTFF